MLMAFRSIPQGDTHRFSAGRIFEQICIVVLKLRTVVAAEGGNQCSLVGNRSLTLKLPTQIMRLGFLCAK